MSQRLTAHRQNGSIHSHFKNCHDIKPEREQLTENTKIIARANNRHRLAILEALLILKAKPIINKQFDNFFCTLKLYGNNNNNSKTENYGTHRTDTCEALSPSRDPLPNRDADFISETKVNPDCKPNLELNPDFTGENNKEPSNIDLDNQPKSIFSISPRTMRLLTSPIRLDNIFPNMNDSTMSSICVSRLESRMSEPKELLHEIPDMREVLKRFNINTDSLKEVNIKDYQWSRMDVSGDPRTTQLDFERSDILSPTYDNREPTISQRIRTLVRHTKTKRNSQ